MAVSFLFTSTLLNQYCLHTQEQYALPYYSEVHSQVEWRIIIHEGGQRLLKDLDLAGISLLHYALNMQL